MSETTRPYHSPLREQRAAETQVLILEALAAIIDERGAPDFSVQEVADGAGVALRTVYRHFSDRQALLDGLAQLVDEELEAMRVDDERGWQQLETVDDLLEAARTVFAYFDALVPLTSAMALLSAAGYQRSRSHDARTQAYRRILTDHLGELEDPDAQATFGVIRHLVSANTWYTLRLEFGLTGEEAGRAVTRSIDAILGRN